MFRETTPIDIDTACALASDGWPAGEGAGFARNAQRAGAQARDDASTAPAAAPYSNYGAKDSPRKKQKNQDDDLHTGERVELQMRRGRVVPVRQIDAIETAPSQAALIDALSFSIKPASHIEQPSMWVLDELSRFIPIKQCCFKPRKGGYAGFKFAADIEGIGLIAWGGERQRGTVHFSMMGGGSSTIHDMLGLQHWLQKHKAKLKRVDVAHDDFEGHSYNMHWAITQYHQGGFNAGGRKPKHQCFGAWLDDENKECRGLTLAIGNRASGKYCRIYQKGKMLGDASSNWTRLEVEWRDQDRDIPYDILTNPGQYLAGAYPCFAQLSAIQSVIKTVAKAAKIVYEKAIENAKQQVGKLINVMLRVEGGDYAAVINKLIREGVPKRIEPWSYHISHTPAVSLELSP